ncbi:hypothetical protein H632_c123p2 [Helicosporidium sp. ATCC 50920]|nr:hypothetical protein H632_c123p2 [Helicosporidium sp. ATCC 50920]|eukprot:KDD76738.1 hypothetical protein H632_c123p2 [Helicosporidium sp. ATCC 50920]
MPVRSSGEAAASSSTAARESTPSRARDGPGPTQAPRVLSSETVDPTGLASVNPPSSAPSRDAAASVEGASHAVALALHGATRRLEDLRLTPPVSGGAEERERAVQAVLGTVQQCAQALASLHACQSAAAALRWTTR